MYEYDYPNHIQKLALSADDRICDLSNNILSLFENLG
jgi:hypothetical protein